MVLTTALVTIGKLIVSYAFGCLFYYVTATEERNIKKKLLDELLALTINFVIFIWIGKILSQGLRIFRDPLAALAYPSNAASIYIATSLFIVHLLYRHFRKGKRDEEIIRVATPVVLATVFIYESVETIFHSGKQSLMIVVFLMVLLFIHLFKPDHFCNLEMAVYLLLIFLLGCIVFAVTIGAAYVSIFYYRLHLLYFISLFILIFSTFMFMKRRQN
ncbi:MAG TPA: hypothetical protein VK029_07010 [Pseudogracilibacillus sp.]|nr:hypothetical protein [Pseudogracilibacillus sp.]